MSEAGAKAKAEADAKSRAEAPAKAGASSTAIISSATGVATARRLAQTARVSAAAAAAAVAAPRSTPATSISCGESDEEIRQVRGNNSADPNGYSHTRSPWWEKEGQEGRFERRIRCDTQLAALRKSHRPSVCSCRRACIVLGPIAFAVATLAMCASAEGWFHGWFFRLPPANASDSSIVALEQIPAQISHAGRPTSLITSALQDTRDHMQSSPVSQQHS